MWWWGLVPLRNPALTLLTLHLIARGIAHALQALDCTLPSDHPYHQACGLRSGSTASLVGWWMQWEGGWGDGGRETAMQDPGSMPTHPTCWRLFICEASIVACSGKFADVCGTVCGTPGCRCLWSFARCRRRTATPASRPACSTTRLRRSCQVSFAKWQTAAGCNQGAWSPCKPCALPS